jgi:putative nucleotidyltransferase with HDIG domain
MFPSRVGKGNLDETHRGTAEERAESILTQLGERIARGGLDVPTLPQSSLVVLDITSNVSVPVQKITDAIERDPVLSSELVRTANSVTFAGAAPAETLRQAVIRLGVRNLRSAVIGYSMKVVLSRTGGIAEFAKEIWRQSNSMGRIARTIASMSGRDPDKAFLLGLVHDIGKVPILDQIGRIAESRSDVTRMLIGQAFSRYHESLGAIIAKEWKLPEEIVAVAECHHDFRKNERFPDSAALVSFAHRLDLHLSLGGERDYWKLMEAEEAKQLGISAATCRQILQRALEEFSAAESGVGAAAV